MTAEKVAKIGYKAMKTGKRTVTAGFMNKLMVLSARLLPTGFISMISKKMMERKN